MAHNPCFDDEANATQIGSIKAPSFLNASLKVPQDEQLQFEEKQQQVQDKQQLNEQQKPVEEQQLEEQFEEEQQQVQDKQQLNDHQKPVEEQQQLEEHQDPVRQRQLPEQKPKPKLDKSAVSVGTQTPAEEQQLEEQQKALRKRKLLEPKPKRERKPKPKKKPKSDKSPVWVGPQSTGVNWVQVSGFPYPDLTDTLRSFNAVGTILSAQQNREGIRLHYTDRVGFLGALQLDGTRVGRFPVTVQPVLSNVAPLPNGDAMEKPFVDCHPYEEAEDAVLRERSDCNQLEGRFMLNLFVFFWWCVDCITGRWQRLWHRIVEWLSKKNARNASAQAFPSI